MCSKLVKVEVGPSHITHRHLLAKTNVLFITTRLIDILFSLLHLTLIYFLNIFLLSSHTRTTWNAGKINLYVCRMLSDNNEWFYFICRISYFSNNFIQLVSPRLFFSRSFSYFKTINIIIIIFIQHFFVVFFCEI